MKMKQVKYYTFFFEWAKIYKTKFLKNTKFVKISLNFSNNQ